MCHFFLDSTYKGCHTIFVVLSDLLYSAQVTLKSIHYSQFFLPHSAGDVCVCVCVCVYVCGFSLLTTVPYGRGFVLLPL